jgi:hypothetical protein
MDDTDKLFELMSGVNSVNEKEADVLIYMIEVILKHRKNKQYCAHQSNHICCIDRCENKLDFFKGVVVNPVCYTCTDLYMRVIASQSVNVSTAFKYIMHTCCIEDVINVFKYLGISIHTDMYRRSYGMYCKNIINIILDNALNQYVINNPPNDTMTFDDICSSQKDFKKLNDLLTAYRGNAKKSTSANKYIPPHLRNNT